MIHHVGDPGQQCTIPINAVVMTGDCWYGNTTLYCGMTYGAYCRMVHYYAILPCVCGMSKPILRISVYTTDVLYGCYRKAAGNV